MLSINGATNRRNAMNSGRVARWGVVGLALCAAPLVAARPAIAATGADIHAAEKAVAAHLGQGTHAFFSAVFETRTAVCGVVTTDDGDARFIVELTAGAGGKRTPGAVFIDGLAAPAFDAIWTRDCASSA